MDLNATQAATRAGYSQKTAGKIGGENLQKPEIQRALQIAMARREERTEITQDRVLRELEKVGFSNAGDYTDANLKYSNKLRALELLGKHLGLFDGKGGQPAPESNLLDAIVASAEEEIDTDDLPETL